MDVNIGNTGILRVTNAKITALDGTSSDVSVPGELTILDRSGVEVVGQVWPTALTLNSPGDYSAIMESDLALNARMSYTALVTFGTEPNSRAKFNVLFTAKVRADT
jgi:hypothetical protein